MSAPGRKGDAAETPRMPLRFGDDPLLWAAWLYYEEGLTQNDIAQAMAISRPTVNAYLAEARDRGIVTISIDGARLRALSLARRLVEHFDLADCLVIPSEGGARSLIERLGDAGAQALGWHLRPADALGIAWGRTMLALAEAMPDPGLRDLRVVQATGGTTARIPYTPEACATRLSEALSARMVPLSAPAIVSDPAVRELLLREPVLAEQMGELDRITVMLTGVSSLRPNSTIHTSGFFASALEQHDHYQAAVGSIAGRFIDDAGRPVIGPLDARTIGIGLEGLRQVRTRIGVAGGFDKVPAILAALRGGYVNVLVTDAATAEAVLRADGAELAGPRGARRAPATGPAAPVAPAEAGPGRVVKKFLNDPRDAVRESLEGAVATYPQYLAPAGGEVRALVRPGPRTPGKVGLLIGGGAGHEPCFLGYVGEGLADAVVVGNVFASPPPDRILRATMAADAGAGVLCIYGNYTGDVMNFDMAAELATAAGVEVRSVLTTDDIASAPEGDRLAGRGTAGNVFIFKIAGAACARGLALQDCERLARKANAATATMGLALEAGALPETRRPSFRLGPDEMEIGIGIHGEPGVARHDFLRADAAADLVMDRLIDATGIGPGARVAVLVNSLGTTPMIELMILARRVHQRLAAHEVRVVRSLAGHYCTSLDMTGASITLMRLDDELEDLLAAPCDGFALRWS